jgi:hypothetical protein
VTIGMGESSEGQIMVTFLSPDLVRAVTMNEALLENPNEKNPELSVGNSLTQLANREKLIFLLTVVSVNMNGETTIPHKLEVKADEILLLSANRLEIKPSYVEPSLDQPLDLSQYNFGYLFYPLAVINNGVCTEVLNQKFDTNIVLTTSAVTIDNAASDPLLWAIEYKPLLDIGHSDLVTGDQNSYYESDPQPLDIPPVTSDTTSRLFWQEYAKFVWGHLTP